MVVTRERTVFRPLNRISTSSRGRNRCNDYREKFVISSCPPFGARPDVVRLKLDRTILWGFEMNIQLFGEFEITDSKGLSLDLPSKKAQVLLAALALNRGREISRQRAAELLWSNRSEEQARSSLRQTLTRLRKVLDQSVPDALSVSRSSLSLLAKRVTVDVVQFEDACARGMSGTDDASGLYRGDFLDGLNTRDPVADDWLESERSRLRTMFIASQTALLDTECSQSTTQLAEMAERLLKFDPSNEVAHRTLMRTYATHGDRQLALEQYNACATLLENELDATPSKATEDLHQAIIEERAELPGPGRRRTERESLREQRSIIVLPFNAIPDNAESNAVADGVTADIIAKLSRFSELYVIARKSSFALRGLDVDLAKIKQDTGVCHAVAGTVRCSGNRLKVDAELIDLARGINLWADQYERTVDDLLVVQEEIARSITAIVGGQVKTIQRQETRLQATNTDAYQYLIKGLGRWNYTHNRDDLLYARGMYERAIKTDGRFAAAFVELGVTYMMEFESPWALNPFEAAQRSLELTRQAIALDNSSGSAHCFYAWALLLNGEYDLADFHTEKALALNPNDYENYCTRAWTLCYMSRPEEALAVAEEGQRLNPIAPSGSLTVNGVALYMLGRYGDAAARLAQAPDRRIEKLACEAACHTQLGHLDKANAFAAETQKVVLATADGAEVEWGYYWSRQYKFRKLADLTHLLDGFRRAGIPCSVWHPSLEAEKRTG